jgi:hypothetical protein
MKFVAINVYPDSITYEYKGFMGKTVERTNSYLNANLNFYECFIDRIVKPEDEEKTIKDLTVRVENAVKRVLNRQYKEVNLKSIQIGVSKREIDTAQRTADWCLKNLSLDLLIQAGMSIMKEGKDL